MSKRFQQYAMAWQQDFHRAFSWKVIACSLGVSLCMIIDIGYGASYVLTQKDFSVFYYFFNTIIFTGMYGTYISSMIVALPYATALNNEVRTGFSYNVIARSGFKPYINAKFWSSVLAGGFTMMLGYMFFIAILSTQVPFINEQDLLSGLDYYPYVSISLEGNVPLHLIVIAYYGFLTGCLWSSLAVTVSIFTRDAYLVIASPFVAKFVSVQIFRALRVPNNYRIDSWLYMRSSLTSHITTIIASLAGVLIILLLCKTIFCYKAQRRLLHV